MNLGQLAVRIAQRGSQAIVATALALGLAAVVMAPTVAQAAPLSPGKRTPTYAPDLIPEAYLFVYANATVRAAISVRNRGSWPASPARFEVRFPLSHSVTSIVPPPGTKCSQANDFGFAVVTCTVGFPLAPDDAVTVEIFGKPAYSGLQYYGVTVDPKNEVREGSESNNYEVFETVVL